MSLHSFTVLADSLRKKDDLDLCPTHFHSLPGSCRFAFHVLAWKQALAVSPRATMQRSGWCGSPTPNWSTPYGRCEKDDDFGVQLANQAHPCPDTSSGCFRKVPSLPDFPMSHSVTRSVLIPRPAAAARLCFALPPQQVKCGPAGDPGKTCALRVTAFRKSFRQNSAQNADEKIIRTFRKSAAWPWERGTSRRFAQECPE